MDGRAATRSHYRNRRARMPPTTTALAISSPWTNEVPDFPLSAKQTHPPAPAGVEVHASSLIASSQISLMRVFSGQEMSKRVQFRPPSVEWKTPSSHAA